MGVLKKLKKLFNEGRHRTVDESDRRRKQEEKIDIPIELVQPNRGRFVTLKITEKDAFLKGEYINKLSAYALAVKNIYPDTVIIIYKDSVTLKLNKKEEAKAIRSLLER